MSTETTAASKSCPYCRLPVTAVSQVVECPDCGTAYHQECWHEGGRCIAPECPSAQPQPVALETAASIPPPPPAPLGASPQAQYPAAAIPGEIGVKAVLSYGWAGMQKHIALAILGFVLVQAIAIVTGLIPVVNVIAPFFLIPPLMGGLMLMFLKIVEDRNPEFSDIFSGFSNYGRWVGAQFLYAAISLLPAMILAAFMFPILMKARHGGEPSPADISILMAGVLIIAIIVAVVIIRFVFVYFLVAEGYGVMDAFRTSARMTEGLRLRLFGILCVLGLVSAAGILACGVGVLFTMPLAVCAQAALYSAVKTLRGM